MSAGPDMAAMVIHGHGCDQWSVEVATRPAGRQYCAGLHGRAREFVASAGQTRINSPRRAA
jgi:hypothetical protein